MKIDEEVEIIENKKGKVRKGGEDWV